MIVHEGRIFLIGEGASADGDHPFLDALDLASGATTRLWQSALPGYERPVTLLDPEALTVILRHESPDEPPNYSITSLPERKEASPRRRAITAFTHPYPPLREATKTLMRYARRDGVELSGTLHLPAGYDADRDGPLPLVMWAYPQGFKSTGNAEQVRAAPHRFEPIGWSSPLLWLTQGYAVFDDPSMPIIGEGETEPNDTYVEQLAMNAEAAVDAVVARGVASRERIAIGGHSYGAFMTAHLLAHTDLFRAGIARSGSYNRTLTPFGFQSEERTMWQAPNVYEAMSAFHVADRITAPLLLIHGKADDNSGTYPEQSERFYDALKGLGKTVRLVLLPHESHGYRARESVMHVMWEMVEWLRVHMA
jgi:dipeptidyl aminopeptidase/acylaminoacyl peptidase